MDSSPSTRTTVAVDPRLVSYTQLMYALHALAILIGLVTSASIAGKFVFGLPSIIAVIMNYARRSEVRDNWLDAHFSWQLRTFWFAFGALIVTSALFWPLVLLLIGIPLVWLSYLIIAIWVSYRIVRGWLALRDGRTLPRGRL